MKYCKLYISLNKYIAVVVVVLATENLWGKYRRAPSVLPDTRPPICYHVTQNSQLNHAKINQWIIYNSI